MQIKDSSQRPTGRQRTIGPIGTTARIIVGIPLLGSVLHGHLARGFHFSAWVLGLVGFPAGVFAAWLRFERGLIREPPRRRQRFQRTAVNQVGSSGDPATWSAT